MADGDPQRGATLEEVDDERAGQRLDNYLIARLKGVPRSLVYRLIRSGQVRVNSGRCSPGYRLKPGDKVRIPPVRRASAKPPEPSGLGWLERRIIFEDDRIIVVNKPAGLAVHGGSAVGVGCIEGLRSLRPSAKTLELVHRLDRGTSGCLLVAKRRSSLRALHALLREGGIEKRYLTLVKGRWPQGRKRVETTLAREPRGPGAKVRVAPEGKTSASEFRHLSDAGTRASYLEVVLETGRTHQIRVQAAHLGHPVAGDERYGDADFNGLAGRLGLERLFLHAHAVAFTWPGTDEEFAVSVPLPDELKRVLDAFSEM